MATKIMGSKGDRRVDKILNELGLSPGQLNPEELYDQLTRSAKKYGPSNSGPCSKAKYPSEQAARKHSKRIKKRGANTSFFRPYFCDLCKSWHLTSNKSHIAGRSTMPKRSASHRRKHDNPNNNDHT